MLKETPASAPPIFLGYYPEHKFVAGHYQSIQPLRPDSPVLLAIKAGGGYDVSSGNFYFMGLVPKIIDFIMFNLIFLSCTWLCLCFHQVHQVHLQYHLLYLQLSSPLFFNLMFLQL